MISASLSEDFHNHIIGHPEFLLIKNIGFEVSKLGKRRVINIQHTSTSKYIDSYFKPRVSSNANARHIEEPDPLHHS